MPRALSDGLDGGQALSREINLNAERVRPVIVPRRVGFARGELLP